MEDQKIVWQRFPSAEEYLSNAVEDLQSEIPFLNKLALRLRAHAGAQIMDWIDFVITPEDHLAPLETLPFELEFEHPDYKVFHVPNSYLPGVVVGTYGGIRSGAAVRVDRVAEFQAVHNCPADIEGEPFSGFRRALVDRREHKGVFAVERRVPDIIEPYSDKRESEGLCAARYQAAWEIWMSRPRKTFERPNSDNVRVLMDETRRRATHVVELVGKDMAADVVMHAERTYWQAKNDLGRNIKFQLDQLGMGWANHDHHTFRCSRDLFSDVIQIMQLLGFELREKFFAGNEAGWGAQVMEHPTGFALFIDTDLDAHEIDIDFTVQSLPVKDSLGTVGLWCRLHGESIFDAGLHHVAGRFDFRETCRRLSETNEIMEPFSDFSYLKQAFTRGQRWPVARERIVQLIGDNLLTDRQAGQFTHSGALGSHLEIIQRKEGFKGFNQQNVSDIIQRTDPRKNR